MHNSFGDVPGLLDRRHHWHVHHGVRSSDVHASVLLEFGNASCSICGRIDFDHMEFRLPPQYVSFDESNPYPRDCPKTDVGGVDGNEDPTLYEPAPTLPSPIIAEAGSVAKLPPVS